MIGQVFIGRAFGGVVRYVMSKAKAEILAFNGVRTCDPISTTHDFNLIRNQRPSVKNAVWHASISFAFADKLTTSVMVEIGKEYLQKIGLAGHQYIIVRHHDTKHEHFHIISNRIGFEGQLATDRFSKNRTAAICDELEVKYGLTVARNQRSITTINDKVPLRKLVKTNLYDFISQAIDAGVNSLDQLENELKKHDVHMHLQIQKTGRINGISFKHQHLTFKGSSIDKSFSYVRILKKLMENNLKYKNDKRRKN